MKGIGGIRGVACFQGVTGVKGRRDIEGIGCQGFEVC